MTRTHEQYLQSKANRVSLAIDRVRPRVAALDDAKRIKLDADMAVDFSEHFAYQQEQARAHAEGLLTPDEAQIIYIALGENGDSENGGWATDTDAATKVIITKVIGELLSARIEGRKLRKVS